MGVQLHRNTQLGYLSVWISEVAHQPTAIWWAVRQYALHPRIRKMIRFKLREVNDLEIRKAWEYLINYWEQNNGSDSCDWYDLENEIKQVGWSHQIVRKYANSMRPFINVKEDRKNNAKPSFCDGAAKLNEMIRLDVEYPDFNYGRIDIAIPDMWIPVIVEEMRKNLEVALTLETEVGGSFWQINSIAPDTDSSACTFSRSIGVFGYILFFVTLFERLIKLDLDAAKRDFSKWKTEDDHIFGVLRIWALGNAELVPDNQLGSVISGLGDRAFWNTRFQRDLLRTLAARWNVLDEAAQFVIEERLLAGRSRWNHESQEDFEERRAWEILQSIHWLDRKCCDFHFDLNEKSKQLRKLAPDWQPEHADRADECMGPRSGSVETNTEHSELLNVSPRLVLSRAKQLSGEHTLGQRNRPFNGYAKRLPVKAFTALRLTAKQGDFPEWAWRAFLSREARENDKPKFIAFIAEQLPRYPDEVLSTFLWSITSWLSNTSKCLATQYPVVFDRLVRKVCHVLLTLPESGSSSLGRTGQPDWGAEALNSAVGDLSMAIMSDPRKDELKEDEGFPIDWLEYPNLLLSLPDDLHRYAIYMLTRNLTWFFTIDPEWTKQALLPYVTSEVKENQDVFWEGFFGGGRIPHAELYQCLKADMLDLAKQEGAGDSGYGQMFAGTLLAGWVTSVEGGELLISDDDFREVLISTDDTFRSHVLWQVSRWDSEDKDRWLPLLLKFLKDVWPLQITARSSLVSVRLCDLLFSSCEQFSNLVEYVIPLLTKIDKYFLLPNLEGREQEDGILARYPNQVLDVLYIVLPEKTSDWPHDFDDFLSKIIDADNSTKSNKKLIELKKRWDLR